MSNANYRTTQVTLFAGYAGQNVRHASCLLIRLEKGWMAGLSPHMEPIDNTSTTNATYTLC